MSDPDPAPRLAASSVPDTSVVVPFYSEYEVLPSFHRRLCAVLDGLPGNHEIIYVNDGSQDHSPDLVRGFQAERAGVALVDLARNFGKEIALTAGLDQSRGRRVVVIDADLQDPPELIPELLAGLDQGYEVVYARRASRQGESALKRATAKGFYKLIGRLAEVPIPPDTGDYRAMSRRAVDALAGLRERHRFMKGLYAWIGFPQKEVVFHRDPRYRGKSKWNYWKLWNFALEGITGFTTLPLRLATYLGFCVAGGSFVYMAYVILNKLFGSDDVPGYPSLMSTMLFLGGVQLMCLGVIGEYLGRVFSEAKSRPLYLLKSVSRSRADGSLTEQHDIFPPEPGHGSIPPGV